MSVQLSTDEDFEKLLGEHNKIVVKYFANWCGSCKLFAPKFRRLSEDERFTDVHFIDVNAEHNPLARKMAGVDHLPFFATFRNGSFLKGVATSNEEVVLDLLTNLN